MAIIKGNNHDNSLNGTLNDDFLFGLSGNDSLHGGEGNDFLKGDGGNDSLFGSYGHDFLEGDAGNDTLVGFSGNDTLLGNDGNDVLLASDGRDHLIGGLGDDNYVLGIYDAKIVETKQGGVDTVSLQYSTNSYTLAAFVENLTLGIGAYSGTGNNLANVINGNTLNNTLSGGKGKDTMLGGAGDDTYYVTKGDQIIEKINGGMDKIFANTDWELTKNLESLTLSGTDNINGMGNKLNNTLIGNTGDNLLDAKSGIDTVYADAGNDRVVIRELDGYYSKSLMNDYIDGGDGNDTLVLSGADNTIDLQRDNIFNIEAVDLTGSGANSLLNVSETITQSHSFSVFGNSDDTVSLSNYGGQWVYAGAANGMNIYTLGATELLISESIVVIQDDKGSSQAVYTISDANSAKDVGNFFDDSAQTVRIDFGAQAYHSVDVSQIDLTGFGLEDTLIVAQHDGACNSGKAHYVLSGNSRSFISDNAKSGFGPDRVLWNRGDSKAYLASMHLTTFTFSSNPSSVYKTLISSGISIIGLPQGLADTQFVFV